MLAGSPPAELLDLDVDALLDALADPADPAASGSAAALAAAMAAAVAEKAARRSRGRWEDAGGASAQAHALRLRAAPLASADARALAEAAELLERRDDDRSPEHRDHELGRALGRAAELPLLIAQIGADIAALAREIAAHGDHDARADAAAAASLAQAATRAAAHLVEVNLGTTSEDLRVHSARSLAAAAEAWAAAALALDP